MDGGRWAAHPLLMPTTQTIVYVIGEAEETKRQEDIEETGLWIFHFLQILPLR